MRRRWEGGGGGGGGGGGSIGMDFQWLTADTERNILFSHRISPFMV